MKEIRFSIRTASSPWDCGQPKAHHSCVRLEMVCTETSWIDSGVTSPSNVSNAIFAYLKTGDSYAFNHVCSAVDLVELPEEEGGMWCRRSSVDLLLPAFEIAEEAHCKILSDIEFLTREINSYRLITGISEIEVCDGYGS